MLTSQKDENAKVNGYLKTKIPNMAEFFPLKDSESLERFLDSSDGLFHLRRAEFANLLIPCVSEKKNLFGTAVLNSLFSDEFVKTHSWPTNRYYKFI